MTATTLISRPPAGLHEVEQRLPTIRDAGGRLAALNQLCAYYAYTSGQKTRTYLRELAELQAAHPHPEIELSLLVNTATLEGLLYNHELAYTQYQRTVPLLEERGDSDTVADVCIDYAGTCMNLERFDEAAALLAKARKQLGNSPNERLRNRLRIREAHLALREGETDRAAALFSQAYHAYQRAGYSFTIKDRYFHTLLHSGLGNMYTEIANHERARENYERVVDICETYGLRNRLSFHYLFLGNVYLSLGDHLKSEEFWRKSIAQQDDSSPAARAGAYANLGKIYTDDQRYAMALKMFDSSERVFRNIRTAADYENRALLDQWRADVYFLDNREADSIRCLKSSYKHAQQSGAEWLIIKVQRKIADYYAHVKDFERAYEWRTKCAEDTVAYYEELQSQSINKVEQQYEAALKKQETEKLKIRASELQMKALRAQMNPHFIFNSLNAIQYDIEHKNTDVAVESLTKFARLMRSSLAYSELDRITVEDEITFLQSYLDINATLRFEGKMSYRITVDDELEDDILEIPTMIVQPYIENSIEHGIRSRDDGHIEIRFELLEDDENVARVIVEDNGIGRTASAAFNSNRRKEHRSMGTRITQDRLVLLHPTRTVEEVIRITDIVGEDGATCRGTRVEILLPLTEGGEK